MNRASLSSPAAALPRALALCAALCAAAAPTARAADPSDALRRDIAKARDAVYPALVNIGVVARQFSGGRAHRAPGAGSGVIVDRDGHVLTNFHVAGHTVRLTCTLPSGERIPADVVTHDPLTDLSVLKLRLDQREEQTPLPFAAIGDSSALKVGEYVLAMGNPLSLSSSLTLGVVSNTGRVFTNFQGTDLEEMDLGQGEVTGLFTRWIQHDALILPGNSGGPLVNLRGEVVGINELGGNGVGFAIPSNLAKKVLSQSLEHGEVRRGWLGLTVLPVDKLGRDDGALVSSVVDGSPAHAAGLRPGDVLTRLGDADVSVTYVEQVPEFYEQVAELQPGGTVPITLQRGGEEVQVEAKVERMEPFLGDEREFKKFGLTVRAITGPMALARRFPDTQGVLVTGIRAGHPFEMARPRLREGDVIRYFDGQRVRGMDDFGGLLAKAAEKDKDTELLVGYSRGEEEWLTLVNPPADDPKQRGGELSKAWLGVEAQVLTTKLAEALGLPKKTRGFRITQVFQGTEAAKAGLQPGDIITSVDDEPLDAHRPRDSQELRLAVEQLVIGEAAPLGILRGGEAKTIPVVMQPSPASVKDVESGRDDTFEVAVRELTFMDRVQQRWAPEQEGLLVMDVTSGGWAHMAGLRVGDLILAIDDEPVTQVDAFEARMKAIGAAQPPLVKIFVRRDNRTHFVFIEPDWAAEARPAGDKQ